MIVQILRAAFIAIALYLITKLARNFIDKKLDGSPNSDNTSEEATTTEHLEHCPKCGVYYASDSEHHCDM